MGHTQNSIERVREHLDMATPPDAHLSTLAAIETLLPTITGMRKRGFSLANIATLLKESGLTISEGTLKNYIQRLGRTSTKLSMNKVRADATARAIKVAVSRPAKRAAFEPRSESYDIGSTMANHGGKDWVDRSMA